MNTSPARELASRIDAVLEMEERLKREGLRGDGSDAQLRVAWKACDELAEFILASPTQSSDARAMAFQWLDGGLSDLGDALAPAASGEADTFT